jgi:hypothetical protein
MVGTTSALQAEVSLEEKIDLLSAEVDKLRGQVEKTGVAGNTGGTGQKTTLGGYGELHYNNLDSGKEIDLHRFVLFIGHRFTDRVRMHSELEFEHGVTSNSASDPGEVEVEQAYVEMDVADRHAIRAGVFLMPIGIINETHEPPTFFGVERNPVETSIIPATWWEAGVGMSGALATGLYYDLAVTSGLSVDTTGASAYLIRPGRQKAAEAEAENGAYTARLKWSGIRGLQLAASVNYQTDLTQGAGAAGTASSAWLGEIHGVLSRGDVGLRVLYAQWTLDGSEARAAGRDQQYGWYVEPSYRLWKKTGFFLRHAQWNNEAGSGDGGLKKQNTVGVNYWPVPEVVIKLDVQGQSGAVDNDGFNLGVGYMF